MYRNDIHSYIISGSAQPLFNLFCRRIRLFLRRHFFASFFRCFVIEMKLCLQYVLSTEYLSFKFQHHTKSKFKKIVSYKIRRLLIIFLCSVIWPLIICAFVTVVVFWLRFFFILLFSYTYTTFYFNYFLYRSFRMYLNVRVAKLDIRSLWGLTKRV